MNKPPACGRAGAWFALAGIIYTFFAMETKGRTIEEIDGELAKQRGDACPVAENS